MEHALICDGTFSQRARVDSDDRIWQSWLECQKCGWKKPDGNHQRVLNGLPISGGSDAASPK